MIDRRVARCGDYTPLGQADLHEHGENSVMLQAGDTRVEVTALAPDLFRVGMFAGGRPSRYASEAVAREEWPPPACRVEHRNGEISLRTDAGSATIALDPLRIGFTNADGRTVAADDPDLGMGLYPLGNAAPLEAQLGPPARMYKRRVAGERYFGCGERTGGLEKTDSHQIFWNVDPPGGHGPDHNNLYVSIPFLLALQEGSAWGLFLDNPGLVEFDLAHEDPDRCWFSTDAGDLVYYVFTATSPAGILARYTELTGRTPLPPLWALGNHQSRYSYMSEEEVLEVAREFRERGIPCDALYLDIDYMDGYRVFTWNQERFPNPEGLTRQLREMGFRMVTILDPGVKVDEGYEVYRDGRREDVFCKTFRGHEYHNVVWPGTCAFPDFTSSRAREWWGRWVKTLIDAGISGIWCDMDEPALFIALTSTMPPDVVHEGDDSPQYHVEIHNLYGSLTARATRDGVTRALPDERPFVISRSGYAGLQRHAIHWTGDNSSWWQHLWMAMPQLQNLGLSGLAWAGVDVGGFGGDTSGELLARWTEFGAFQPFCRNHSAKGTRRQEPWLFGEPWESAIRDMLRLRQRLLPYLYGLFDECARTGAPVLRPLLYHYPADAETYARDDEFLLGEGLLVAPVYQPGTQHRYVYLPEGTWSSWWTGERIEGPAHILAEAPIGRPPLYLKACVPLPLWPESDFSEQGRRDPLTLVVASAPGCSGQTMLYEDAGNGHEYLEGAFLRRSAACSADSQSVTVEIGAVEGTYRPQRERIVLEVRDARPVRTAHVNGEPADWETTEGGATISLPEMVGSQTVVLGY